MPTHTRKHFSSFRSSILFREERKIQSDIFRSYLLTAQIECKWIHMNFFKKNSEKIFFDQKFHVYILFSSFFLSKSIFFFFFDSSFVAFHSIGLHLCGTRAYNRLNLHLDYSENEVMVRDTQKKKVEEKQRQADFNNSFQAFSFTKFSTVFRRIFICHWMEPILIMFRMICKWHFRTAVLLSFR